MAAIIKIVDIDEAITHLKYKNKDTLKYKLVHAIRQYYGNEISSEFLHQINTEDLVKNLWCIGDDPELVKTKRKNLSSVKSSINADLKRLYKEGKNPQGVIIGQNNVFDMSHEAKDKALETIADVLKKKGTDTIGKIAEVLKTVNDVLSDSGSVLTVESGLEKYGRMKEFLLDLSRKVGFSLPGDTGMRQASGTDIVTGIGTGTGSKTGTVTGDSIGTNYGTTDDTIVKGEGTQLAGTMGGAAAGRLVHGEELDQFGKEEVIDEIVTETVSEPSEEAVEEILENRLTEDIDQLIEEKVIDEVVAKAAAGMSEEIVEEIPEDGLIEEIDQAIEDAVIDEIVNKAPDDISDEIIDEIPQDETLEENVQDSDTDLITEIVDEVEIGAISGGTDETNEEITKGTVDGAEIDVTKELTYDRSEDGVIEETKHHMGETKENGEFTEVEDDGVEGIQDYGRENLIVDEANSVAALEEDDTVDEVAEVMSDILPMNEPPVEGDLEEIAADSDLKEVEGQEILPEQIVSDGVLEDQQNAEGDLEEIEAVISTLEETAGEENIDEQGEVVDEIVDEDLRTKAEVLAKLAEAAKILEKLGPELNDSVYSEEEIKEKAKLLSEDFERELSIREKYFNQHILIKGGMYIIGGGNSEKFELPRQKVHILEFYIGKFPVTSALFDIFVEKTGYTTTAERRGYGYVYIPRAQKIRDSATGLETFLWNSNLQYKKVQGACWHRPHGPGSSLYNKRRHPVVQISLEDARAFAAWTGKRIPTEKEWEAAARTLRGYIYPWGNQWKDNACNIEKSYFGDTTPVNKYLAI